MSLKLNCAMLVVTITLVTMVVLSVRPHMGRSLNSCYSLLRQIEGAKAAWALDEKKTTNDTPADSDLFGATNYIRDRPICPQGGVYTIGRVGEKPQCSLPIHSMDFGWVVVCDETGAPVEGAEVSVLGVTVGAEPGRSDTNGAACVTRFPASVSDQWARQATGIAVSRAGFQSTTSTFPSPWPVRIALKRETK